MLVRLCLLIAFTVGPFLSGFLDNLSKELFDADQKVEILGVEVFLPGVRLTLWLGSFVILVAAVLAALSFRAERSSEDVPVHVDLVAGDG